MKTEIYNKNGQLSAYGLACGYVEKEKTETQWKELYFEHNTIHVRAGKIGGAYEVWENFMPNELTKARAFYKKAFEKVLELQD